MLLLALGRHPVAAYREESAPLVWLLGPAVVAMAVPIWQRREMIVSNWKALLLVVALGIAFSAFSVLLLGPFFGWRQAKSLVPKSVTAPVALGIIKEVSLGRAPQDQLIESLLAVGIMISALSGAVLGPVVLRLTGVRDRRAVGLALGCASHGVGTARAFEIRLYSWSFRLGRNELNGHLCRLRPAMAPALDIRSQFFCIRLAQIGAWKNSFCVCYFYRELGLCKRSTI